MTNSFDTSIDTVDVSTRLKYYKRGGSSCIVDVAPPIFVMPFVLDDSGKVIKYVYLHEYKNMFGDTKTSILDISPYNFDSNIDVLKLFVSKYFSIPQSRIELDRFFYLGETDIDISLFKSEANCYAINLTGLLQESEVKIALDEEGSILSRVQYYDIQKGHYLDTMTMAVAFQLMSYFMF